MAIGYFIRLGDKTTCGGEVQEGDPGIISEGLPLARAGDRVSCGKDGKSYVIVGGISHFLSDTTLAAGTLDSFSNCPCKARLIASDFSGSYASNHEAVPQAARAAAQPATPVASDTPPAPRQSSFTPTTSHPTPAAFSRAEPQEPGFYIVPRSTKREELESSLFMVRDPAVMAKFKLLNPNPGVIKAGSMIVLSDPNNLQCTREDAQLMTAAEKVNTALQDLTPDEADFMARHHDEIASFLSEGSAAVGIGHVMFATHLDNLKSTLKQLEMLHQRTFQQYGRLQTPEFFSERKRLMMQLDNSLGPLVRKGTGIPAHPNLKNALGISSRSLVHHWSKAGAPGGIPGYATHIDGVTKASKYIRVGGWVGIGLGALASEVKIHETCRIGREDECRKVTLIEHGKFFGGLIGGGIAGAMVTGPVAAGMCAAIGAGTAGVGGLVCALVVVAGASVAGGSVGESGGEVVGEQIYKLSN